MCFLNQVGPAALDVYHTFEWENPADAKNLDKIQQKFEEYCNPQKNETFERHVFKSRIQGPAESVDQFVTDLRVKAASCNFGMLTDSMIRDQIVSGIRSNQVRERLLREPDLSLMKAVKYCRAYEVSSLHMQDLSLEEKDKESHAVSVQKGKTPSYVQKKKAYHKPADTVKGTRQPTAAIARPEGPKCSNCGYVTHTGNRCPAIGKMCKKCGRIGHFASACRGGAVPKTKGKNRQVHTVYNPHDLDDEDEDNANGLFINSVTRSDKGDTKAQWKVSVEIHGKPVILKIDTGSDVNSLSKTLYDSLCNEPLKPSKIRLIGYFGQQQRPCGKAMMEVAYKSKLYPVEFQIVNAPVVPVLGLGSSMELGLLRRVYTLNAQPAPQVGDPHAILEEFKEVFQGLGCLNYEYDIKIDANVPPVVHPPRRVPFALRSRLKAQLQKMEAEGVIAPVEEPTPWVNSLVVVEKPNGSLRVCIDPRDLNKAILREHYPMKTVEEVAGQLSSAKMFSVLDASQAYYQIKVSEASSNLLCFNSPFGRWKFLRMPYGIKSGSELYQRVASQIFDGLEGVEVIMDDVPNLGSHSARAQCEASGCTDESQTEQPHPEP